MGDGTEVIGFQHLEGQILQLPLEPANAKAVGQGRVDVAGFGGDALLLLRAQCTQGAHVVQPVGQLHQHHADVAGHGQKHLAQVFSLGLGSVGEMDAAQLGDALHQLPHFGSEVPLDFFQAHIGVFHHVVEEPSRDHRSAGADVAQQIRHGHRMDDVGLTGGSHLLAVKLIGEIKGRRQQTLWVGGAGFALARGHMLDALP